MEKNLPLRKAIPDVGTYRPGYLFGRASKNELLESRRLIEQETKKEREQGWSVDRTPVELYGNPLLPDLKKYIFSLAAVKRRVREPLLALEIGIGSGLESLELALHPNIDYLATSLTLDFPHLQMARYVTACTSAELHCFFRAESLDFIFGHHSTHHHEESAFENILFLLRPGGEAFISGEGAPPPVKAFARPTGMYNSLGVYEKGLNWAYWISKRGSMLDSEGNFAPKFMNPEALEK